MGAGGAGVMVAMRIREKNVVKHFRDSGAISPETAKSLTDLRLDEGDFTLRRLHRRAVIRQVHAGEYYLDEEVWAAVKNTRRRIAFVLVTLIIIGLIAFYVNSGARGAPLS